MSTQELIKRLREAEQTLADYEREGKADGWVMSSDLARVTFDRLASLDAENARLKAKLVGVDEKGLEAGVLAYDMHPALHYNEECSEPALRAAIAAYLAAVRDGE